MENSMGMENGAAAASIAAQDVDIARMYMDEAERGISQYMDLDRYDRAWKWVSQYMEPYGRLFSSYYDYDEGLTIDQACEILGLDLYAEQDRLLALSPEDYDADAQDDD